jgi:hypothetical protein
MAKIHNFVAFSSLLPAALTSTLEIQDHQRYLNPKENKNAPTSPRQNHIDLASSQNQELAVSSRPLASDANKAQSHDGNHRTFGFLEVQQAPKNACVQANFTRQQNLTTVRIK